MWMNPDLKIYPTDIYLEDSDSALRTGMSCKAEIIIAQYEDAVYVPVTAVLRVEGEHTLYVVEDGVVKERKVEAGLDDNHMIRIISGLEEGEVVLMTPPLDAATVEPGSRTEGAGSLDDANTTDTMRQRVNQKLEEANGAAQGGPAGPGQEQMGPGGMQMPSAEDMQRMRQRFENMTEEERQQEMQKMRQRFENMSDEEREKMRQQFQQGRGQRQGGGRRQGRGQRSGDGQRQGGGPGQGGGQGPRESGGNP